MKSERNSSLALLLSARPTNLCQTLFFFNLIVVRAESREIVQRVSKVLVLHTNHSGSVPRTLFFPEPHKR